MTKGQEEFIDQMTRKLLVEWCDTSLRNCAGGPLCICEAHAIYRDHATTKKWLSVKDMSTGENKILATGWETAARFLKR